MHRLQPARDHPISARETPRACDWFAGTRSAYTDAGVRAGHQVAAAGRDLSRQVCHHHQLA